MTVTTDWDYIDHFPPMYPAWSMVDERDLQTIETFGGNRQSAEKHALMLSTGGRPTTLTVIQMQIQIQ